MLVFCCYARCLTNCFTDKVTWSCNSALALLHGPLNTFQALIVRCTASCRFQKRPLAAILRSDMLHRGYPRLRECNIFKFKGGAHALPLHTGLYHDRDTTLLVIARIASASTEFYYLLCHCKMCFNYTSRLCSYIFLWTIAGHKKNMYVPFFTLLNGHYSLL